MSKFGYSIAHSNFHILLWTNTCVRKVVCLPKLKLGHSMVRCTQQHSVVLFAAVMRWLNHGGGGAVVKPWMRGVCARAGASRPALAIFSSLRSTGLQPGVACCKLWHAVPLRGRPPLLRSRRHCCSAGSGCTRQGMLHCRRLK